MDYLQAAMRKKGRWLANLNDGSSVLMDAETVAVIREIWMHKAYLPMEKPREYKNVLDLGGCYGYFTIWARKHLKCENIHIYEPSRNNQRMLSANLSINNTQANVFHEAIGDGKPLPFRPFSSIGGHLAKDASWLDFTKGKPARDDGYEVATITIDEAIKRMGGSIDLMKMDIEGAEHDALENCKSLDKIHYAMVEIHGDSKKITDKMLDAGFTHRNITDIRNVHHFVME
jgi:FkbM family methyltransferase